MQNNNEQETRRTAFQNFLNDDTIYTPEQIHEVLAKVRPFFRFAYTGKKHKYFDVPCSFDIETSSFYEQDEDIYIEDNEPYLYIKGHILKYIDNGDIPDFKQLKKKYFGVVKFSKDKGTPVDSFYKELSELFPYYFPEDVWNTSDQLLTIFDVIDQTKPRPQTKCEKVAIMYVWQFGIFGACIVGRTWKEFITMLNVISSELDLNENKRLLVYVHNLSFEFAFISRHFKWNKVFATAPREPIYALTESGLEFRCSYILSGYNLSHLGKELTQYKVAKLDTLDYELLRHNKTPLTKEEMQYCVNDIKVVMSFIMESMEKDGNIARIPLTKTGYARRYVRNNCWYDPGDEDEYKKFRYTQFIHKLKLTPDEYQQLKRGFAGGFTHTNPFMCNKTIYDVTSLDYTSAYPAVMIAEAFPMSCAEMVYITSMEQLEENLSLYWCLFDVEFIGLESQLLFENYISRSRCQVAESAIVDNGRIVSSSRLITTITGEDFQIIKKFYHWDKMRVFNFRRYHKEYLPTDFVKAILKLYSDKTTLKGVKGKEVEYMVSKSLLNATFGMTCTDICKPENIFDGEWSVKEPPLDKMIKKYNRSSSRFLFYPWGLAVTSYNRRNLFTGILEFGNDYCYADTDSLKVVNLEKHQQYVDDYNRQIVYKLKRACDYHGISYDLIEPKTIKGEKKPLGVWDFDGHYTRAKFLGAKRYMVEYDTGEINITVSGLNKKCAVPYILDKYGKEGAFEAFTDQLYIPPEYTGKMTHTYIDEEKEGYVTDYLGNTAHYDELSSVHLSKQDYRLNISREFSDYLSSIIYL